MWRQRAGSGNTTSIQCRHQKPSTIRVWRPHRQEGELKEEEPAVLRQHQVKIRSERSGEKNREGAGCESLTWTFCVQRCHLLLPLKGFHSLSRLRCRTITTFALCLLRTFYPQSSVSSLSKVLNRNRGSHPATVSMCHVIVTCRSMLWTLLSIVAAFGELIAFMSTDWLVGFPRASDAVFGPHGATTAGEAYRPTLGIYGRCIKLPQLRGILCGPYAVHFGEIASGFWQATSIFLAAGILLLCAVAFISVFTMCFQSIMKKSIFNVCGLLQGIAGEILTQFI